MGASRHSPVVLFCGTWTFLLNSFTPVSIGIADFRSLAKDVWQSSSRLLTMLFCRQSEVAMPIIFEDDLPENVVSIERRSQTWNGVTVEDERSLTPSIRSMSGYWF